VDHADGPGDHRRPRGQRPDRLQQLLVPLQDYIVVHRRRVLLEGEQRGRVGQVVGRELGEGWVGGLAEGRTEAGQGNGQSTRRISGNLSFTRFLPL
jgi:hypothetical protein